MPQKADIPFGLEIVQILREGAIFALEELDGMRILHAPIDGHLLARPLRFKGYAGKLHIEADGDRGSQHKHQ